MTTTNGNGNGATTLHGEHGVSGGWNGRGNLAALVKELERQKASKADFTCNSAGLKMTPVEPARAGLDGAVRIAAAEAAVSEFLPSAGAEISDLALVQLGERMTPKVPGGFLKELARSRSPRAAELMSGLLRDDPGTRHFLRSLDGRVRAVLSHKYRVLDHYDLAFTAMDVAKAYGAEVVEASLSERTMRIKFTTKDVWDAVDVVRKNVDGKTGWYAGGLGNQKYLSSVAARSWGDLPGGPGTVHPMVTVTNSETGHGGLGIRVGLLHGICFNLATIEDVLVRVHLGEAMQVGVFSPETVGADTRAIMLKARDSIRAAFTPEIFKRLVAMAKAAAAENVGAPKVAVGNVVESLNLTDATKDSILEYFLRDYDGSTRYGLAQAVARAAQDLDDPDAAADLEACSGKIIKAANLAAACAPAGK